ncbi:MAG TPA: methylmalonyl-CoA epimerase [Caldisericia bacterium]|jgi:methylmalonyl-CoA/ethylmalonyl-CoA epimerase|nr:methylmalonyl-CoA epimerase [Caldisericia bacterium]OQB72819.1 MAG: Glyoxalase/Bleomycin resistance protein/Dioxygenase superfamily protein [bacterium ADurb.Bin132]HNW31318.1 methylmalonyl-CoA epimerase [Caldisericia bacterium]HNY61379.1 methylmalonyl-CoA epimerase [Caldisericia bacterium]HOC79804.1 methylmalonyl-CoA epimerase [Caldisericia bacterium]
MTGLSHIGIATTNIEEAMKSWLLLGFQLIHVTEVPDQKAKIAKLRYDGLIVELLEPTSDDSPIKGFLDKRGPGIHHIALEVDDVDHKIEEFLNAGVKMIDKKSRIGAAGKPIAFIHPSSVGGVLVELEQD